MNRFHVHLSVDDLAKNIDFYTNLFGLEPIKVRDDYAKWELSDPGVNFAISNRGQQNGLNHFGIQVENSDELAILKAQAKKAGHLFDQGQTSCCYAESEKHWTSDPQGISWEHFLTTGESEQYGEDIARMAANGEDHSSAPATCCTPLATKASTDGMKGTDEACCVENTDKRVALGSCCT